MIVRAKRKSQKVRKPLPRADLSVLSGREAHLWSLYQADRSIANRNDLVEFYLPMLYGVANKAKRLLVGVEVEDLVADGSIGLIWAVEHFEPKRGMKFVSCAYQRIHGAMVDAIRRNDHIPRIARRRADMLDSTEIALAEKHRGRLPTDKQVAKSLKLSGDTLKVWRDDAAMVTLKTHSIYACVGTHNACHGNDLEREDAFQGVAFRYPDLRIAAPEVAPEVVDWWEHLLRGLPRAEKAVTILYWRYDWTMKRIGRHLGLSERRVSQEYSATIIFLRNLRKSADFADIDSRGALVKLLRLVLPYCSARRRQLREMLRIREA